MNSRLEHVNRAMHRAFLKEFDVLENGLPILAMIARVAPLLGALGTVFGLMAVMDSFKSLASFGTMEQLHSRALVPAAIGIVTGLMAWLMHRWLSHMTQELRRDASSARFALMDALARMEGTHFQRPALNHHHHLPLLKLEPNHANNLRLALFQASTILLLLYLMVGAANPSSWQPPQITSRALAAALPVANDESPSIWLDHRGELKISRQHLTLAITWDELGDELSRQKVSRWRLYIDQRCAYAHYEDLVEHLQNAGVKDIVHMEQHTRRWL